MTQWRFAVPALVLVSLFSAVTARAASRVQPDDTRLPEAAQRGDMAAVQALLRAHVSVDSAEGDGSTALHWAAYQNNLALAQELLNAHANVNAETRLESITPLYMACESGSAPMVELLLKHGANVNRGDGLGTTPLMMAAAAGNTDVVKVLLDHGADANLKEHAHQQTALMFAANLGRAGVINVLVAHGADPNAASKVEPVPHIVLEEQVVQIKQFGKADEQDNANEDLVADAKPVPDGKKAGGADAEKAMYHHEGATLVGGFTPLLFAVRQDNIAAATALVDGGANINEVSGSEHTTPLVLAIMNGNYDLAKMLVEHGADVNLANDEGIAPLWATEDVQYAPVEWSNEPIVAQEKTDYLSLMKLLLAHGENPNARIKVEPWERVLSQNKKWIKNPGATAFFRAAQAWDVSAMKLLKDNGADPNISTDIGTTPLMAAAGLGWAPNWAVTSPTQFEAVQYCVSLGADVNAQDNLGYTALHGAAFVGDLKVIHYLIDHGENVKAKTKAGDTVADMANGPFETARLHPDVVALLVKLGSVNSNNCRSSDCVVPTVEEKKVAVASTGAVDGTKPANTTLTTGKKPNIK